MTASFFIACLSLGIWIYLLLGHGQFWRSVERDGRSCSAMKPICWPSVVAVVPARNEAAMLPISMRSLLNQDYPGLFSVVLIDDNSSDGTADAAIDAGARASVPGRLTVLSGAPLAVGWTGKLWALSQGIAYAERLPEPPKYLFLTDADIAYTADALCSLVRRAEAGGFVLTSLMARLRCASPAERALIPAFIFFFQMLYPFAWVNRRDCRTAAAAGGCILIERSALAAAGGVATIRGALIDDCALAAKLKTRGRIWLGLSNRVVSLRHYDKFDDVRRMVSRSAYAQLRYSPLLLVGTVLALTIAFLAAPLIALLGTPAARLTASIVWALMALAFFPTLRFYRLSPLWAPLLPVIAAVYLGFTLDSAYQHARGRGGMWKGRAQTQQTANK
jgi:hopene-associated glycosyltransferase HpnB